MRVQFAQTRKEAVHVQCRLRRFRHGQIHKNSMVRYVRRSPQMCAVKISVGGFHRTVRRSFQQAFHRCSTRRRRKSTECQVEEHEKWHCTRAESARNEKYGKRQDEKVCAITDDCKVFVYYKVQNFAIASTTREAVRRLRWSPSREALMTSRRLMLQLECWYFWILAHFGVGRHYGHTVLTVHSRTRRTTQLELIFVSPSFRVFQCVRLYRLITVVKSSITLMYRF
jgi:hypothetical protein